MIAQLGDSGTLTPRPDGSRTTVRPGRLVAALYVAAVTPGFLWGLWACFQNSLESLLALILLILIPQAAAVVGLAISVPTIAIGGLPLYWVYRYLGWTAWPGYALGGALIGAVVGRTVWPIWPRKIPETLADVVVFGARLWSLDQSTIDVVVCGALGAASATVFWACLHARRPLAVITVPPVFCILLAVALA